MFLLFRIDEGAFFQVPAAISSLKQTAKAPDNGLLEDEISFWDGLFSGSVVLGEAAFFSGSKVLFLFFYTSQLKPPSPKIV